MLVKDIEFDPGGRGRARPYDALIGQCIVGDVLRMTRGQGWANIELTVFRPGRTLEFA